MVFNWLATIFISRKSLEFITNKIGILKCREAASSIFDTITHTFFSIQIYSSIGNCLLYHPQELYFQTKPSIIYLLEYQFSYWIANSFLYFILDIAKKDHLQMILHHVVTLSLIYFSLQANRSSIGVVVLFLHNISDAIFSFMKIFHYFQLYNKDYYYATEILYGINLFSYSFWRIYYLNKCVIYDCLSHIQSYMDGCLIGGLCILSLLHIYWFSLMCKIGIRLYKSTDTKRNSHEIEDEEYTNSDKASSKINGADQKDISSLIDIGWNDPITYWSNLAFFLIIPLCKTYSPLFIFVTSFIGIGSFGFHYTLSRPWRIVDNIGTLLLEWYSLAKIYNASDIHIFVTFIVLYMFQQKYYPSYELDIFLIICSLMTLLCTGYYSLFLLLLCSSVCWVMNMVYRYSSVYHGLFHIGCALSFLCLNFILYERETIPKLI